MSIVGAIHESPVWRYVASAIPYGYGDIIEKLRLIREADSLPYNSFGTCILFQTMILSNCDISLYWLIFAYVFIINYGKNVRSIFVCKISHRKLVSQQWELCVFRA